MVLLFECPREVLEERLANRGRGDDVKGTIEKRIITFETQTEEAVKSYDARGKVVRIDASGSKEIVFEEVVKALRKAGVRLDTVQGDGVEKNGEV